MKDYPRHHIVNINGSPGELFHYGSGAIARTADLLTIERYLPRILTQLGVTASTSEVRRNRPELVEDVPDIPHFQRITYGKRVVDIFVY